MTMQKLTGEFQDICHSGESQANVVIKVLDTFYKVGNVVPYTLPTGKMVFAINAEVWNGENKSHNED